MTDQAERDEVKRQLDDRLYAPGEITAPPVWPTTSVLPGQIELFAPDQPVGDRDCWRTPRELFERLRREFALDIDVAADESNHLLPRWWGPGGELPDAFEADPAAMRDERGQPLGLWCNPPFSDIGRWAELLVRLNTTAVMLVPGNRTGRTWWIRDVIGKAAEVRCIPGRVQYVPAVGIKASSCAFDSVFVIYLADWCGPTTLEVGP